MELLIGSRPVVLVQGVAEQSPVDTTTYPEGTGRFMSRRHGWRRVAGSVICFAVVGWEHGRSVARAPVPLREKVRLAAFLARSARWQRARLRHELGDLGCDILAGPSRWFAR